MIASVHGTVLATADNTVIIEVGGIGLQITVTPEAALSFQPGEDALVHTALIVREDELSLYGFVDQQERVVFDLLRSVTGVGPKSALGVLAALRPDEIASAVALDDDAVFRKVSGIGPKTAKLIVISLSGKIHVLDVPGRLAQPKSSSVEDNLMVALVGLGWSERVATQALAEALSQASEKERASVPALLRIALGRLGPAHHDSEVDDEVGAK